MLISKLPLLGLIHMMVLGCTIQSQATVSSSHKIEVLTEWQYLSWPSNMTSNDASVVLNEYEQIYRSVQNWQSLQAPMKPLPAKGHHTLWYRARISNDYDLSRSYLYLKRVFSYFTIIYDQSIIYQFASPQGYHGLPPHIVRLPTFAKDEFIYVRVGSNLGLIGIYGEPKIATHAALLEWIVKRSFDGFVIGAFLFILGIAAVIIFLCYRNERIHLYFGLSAMTTGLYVLAAADMKLLLWDNIFLWGILGNAVRFFVPFFLSRFLKYLFAERLPVWLDAFAWIMFAYAVAACLFAFAAPAGILSFAPIFSIVAHVFLLLLIVKVCVLARHDHQARIIVFGLLVLGIFVSNDYLMEIGLISPWHQTFSWGVLGFMSSLAVVQGVRYRDQTRTKAKMEQQLEVARIVQQTLLPDLSRKIQNIEMAACYSPVAHTGGDWYTYYHEPKNQRLIFLLGDATGHGYGAALLTAVAYGVVQSLFQNQDMDLVHCHNIKKLADLMNRVLHTLHSRMGLGMTMFLGIIELNSGQMHFVNAGHRFPFLMRKGRAKSIVNSGPSLGILPDSDYEIKSLVLQPGDCIFAYTDGLVENVILDGRNFDSRALRRMLAEQSGHPASTVENIQSLLERKASSRGPFDDYCAFAIRWRSAS